MLDALSSTLGFLTRDSALGSRPGVDAWLVPNATRDRLPRIQSCSVPCFAILPAERSQPEALKSPSVIFTEATAVPAVLSGRRLVLEGPQDIHPIPSWLSPMMPLASVAHATVWASRPDLSPRHFYTAFAIPELAAGECIFHHFNQRRFIALLPLLAFLRAVTEEPGWVPPPLQACFMFDDPNLHWSTYGHIDFATLAEHAAKHRYHVASATIPLDAWFVHEPTAALFREHADRISLLMHGNDHVNEELARELEPTQRLGVLAQALDRIEKLERRSKVAVSRFMAPPHGACSEPMLATMAELGYEGACISRGSLEHFNQGAGWTRDIGIRPSDFVSGTPVFSRFRIGRDCQIAIVIAALLRQPIIPVGHHQDVAGGLRLFSELAEFINSLGDVCWRSMSDIGKAHYATRLEGRILRARMHSRLVEITVPDGVRQLVIERPWLDSGSSEPLIIVPKTGSQPETVSASVPLSVVPGQQVVVRSGPAPLNFVAALPRRGLPVWPMARRLLTEARDRVAPILNWV